MAAPDKEPAKHEDEENAKIAPEKVTASQNQEAETQITAILKAQQDAEQAIVRAMQGVQKATQQNAQQSVQNPTNPSQ